MKTRKPRGNAAPVPAQPEVPAAPPSPAKRRLAGADALFILFVAFFSLFLLNRVRDPNRYSYWYFGDAQTLLSVNQWDKRGWINNYFLFLPQGYADFITMLDAPPLSHHAHGINPKTSFGVGPKLWYTHYPAGYLVPYSFLFGVGLTGEPALRAFSVLLSVAALAFMYITLRMITGPPVALIAALFYALNPGFHGFADSLANQPLDDFFRFFFMLAVVMSTRRQGRARTLWLVSAWATEFCLSLCSFDSVFFVYVWLVGWDFLSTRKLDIKKYLLFGMAPVCAHGIQMLQNIWYLGLHDAMKDITHTFAKRSMSGYNVSHKFLNIATPYIELFPLTHKYLWTLPLIYWPYSLFLRGERDDGRLPSFTLTLLLLAAGSAYPIILSSSAVFPYQVRQTLPFISVLCAGILVAGFREWKAIMLPGAAQSRAWPKRIFLLAAFGASVFFWKEGINSFDAWPGIDVVKPSENVRFSAKLAKVPRKYPPAYFELDGIPEFWDKEYMPGYPQINPVIEHYIGDRIILSFTKPKFLIDDLLYLLENTPSRFSPVVVTCHPQVIDAVIGAIASKSGIAHPDELARQVVTFDGRYILDLSGFADSIYWDKKALPVPKY